MGQCCAREGADGVSIIQRPNHLASRDRCVCVLLLDRPRSQNFESQLKKPRGGRRSENLILTNMWRTSLAVNWQMFVRHYRQHLEVT